MRALANREVDPVISMAFCKSSIRSTYIPSGPGVVPCSDQHGEPSTQAVRVILQEGHQVITRHRMTASRFCRANYRVDGKHATLAVRVLERPSDVPSRP